MDEHTPGPWRWQGEDYRGGWGWQMLVGPGGEGLIVGAGPGGRPSELIRAHEPLDPALCITGLAAHGKPHADPVHVFSPANARLIAAAPDLLAACWSAVAEAKAPDGGGILIRQADYAAIVAAISRATKS